MVAQLLRPSIQMEQIGRLVDMSPKEIVEFDAKNNGYGATAKELTQNIETAIKMGWGSVRSGDLLFVFKAIDKAGTIEFNMMAGSLEGAAKDCAKFLTMLKKAGGKTAYVEYKAAPFTEIFKSLGPEFKPVFGKKGNELTMKVRL